MTSPTPTPITPPPAGTVFSKDPVLLTTAFFVVVQGTISALLLASVLSAVAGGVALALVTVLWTAIQMLMVKPATVPMQPLQEYAYAVQTGTLPEEGSDG